MLARRAPSTPRAAVARSPERRANRLCGGGALVDAPTRRTTSSPRRRRHERRAGHGIHAIRVTRQGSPTRSSGRRSTLMATIVSRPEWIDFVLLEVKENGEKAMLQLMKVPNRKAAHDGTTWAMGSHGPMGAGGRWRCRQVSIPDADIGYGDTTHIGKKKWRARRARAPLDDTQCIPAWHIFRDTAAQQTRYDPRYRVRLLRVTLLGARETFRSAFGPRRRPVF